MKNLKPAVDDALRPEYRRSDFGEMVRGKYAIAQVEFAELLRLIMGCIGEEEGLSFIHHSIGNHLANHQPGEWTYEMDNANQVTLRYWLGESENLEQRVVNPPCISVHQEISDVKDLIKEHVRALKIRMESTK